MAVRVFSSYYEFKCRKDKAVNGVSSHFAKVHPNWAELSDTNKGCWNCLECHGCTDCAWCSYCSYCSGCSMCSNCSRCESCESCKYCVYATTLRHKDSVGGDIDHDKGSLIGRMFKAIGSALKGWLK